MSNLSSPDSFFQAQNPFSAGPPQHKILATPVCCRLTVSRISVNLHAFSVYLHAHMFVVCLLPRRVMSVRQEYGGLTRHDTSDDDDDDDDHLLFPGRSHTQAACLQLMLMHVRPPQSPVTRRQ